MRVGPRGLGGTIERHPHRDNEEYSVPQLLLAVRIMGMRLDLPLVFIFSFKIVTELTWVSKMLCFIGNTVHIKVFKVNPGFKLQGETDDVYPKV
ncbi:hypothetical protein NDU88_003252 [Pleurodeles waltl]|uniref:Uncharacterized protein n=1 Tax=Pleurodeles waltl TaxID=8319 RepID=A0AAV7KWI6_PLEWA|nr:hypothetical protein NDU88_003252 [Pleurodeles waltl]